jgi:hypothetical protein
MRRPGNGSCFVRVLKIERARDEHPEWGDGTQVLAALHNSSQFMVGGQFRVDGWRSVGSQAGTPVWVGEDPLPFTQADPYTGPVLEACEKLLEDSIRQSPGVAEIYTRDQVDKLVVKSLNVPQVLVDACILALEDLLKRRTREILKEIQDEKQKAIDEIKKAKPGLKTALRAPRAGNRR